MVKGPQHSFYFAGDTGYCSAFKQIGRKYGPIDFAAIPIGAYYPRYGTGAQISCRCNEKKVKQKSLELKQKNTVRVILNVDFF